MQTNLWFYFDFAQQTIRQIIADKRTVFTLLLRVHTPDALLSDDHGPLDPGQELLPLHLPPLHLQPGQIHLGRGQSPQNVATDVWRSRLDGVNDGQDAFRNGDCLKQSLDRYDEFVFNRNDETLLVDNIIFFTSIQVLQYETNFMHICRIL